MSLRDEIQVTLDDLLEKSEKENPPEAKIPSEIASFGVVPNPILRSSLFGVVRTGRRRTLKKEELTSWGETRIFFTGEQLNQSDLDVWLELCSYHPGERPDTATEFTGKEFLGKMGKGTSSRDYEFLVCSLDRLMSCGVHVVLGEYVYAGSFVSSYIRHEETRRFEVHLEVEMVNLFDVGYTYLDMRKRRTFRSDMDKWMHLFVESHRGEVRVGLEKLRALCGSSTKSIYSFRQKVENSCGRLSERGVLDRYDVTTGVCTFKGS